jgi:GNAT superfamily N-acetyltransferase
LTCVFSSFFAFDVVASSRRPVSSDVRPVVVVEDCSLVFYREVQPDDYEAVQIFLAENGWAVRVSNSERFRAMLDGADRTVVALDGSRVVGFARALCDGVSNGYISMVAVAEDVRRQGIGRRLVEQLMHGDTGGEITWVLRAGRDSRGFWEHLGFTASNIAMERVRRG